MSDGPAKKIPTPLKDPGFNWSARYLTKYVLKTHYPLVILHVVTGVTFVAALGVVFRGLRAPDVGVRKKNVAWADLPPSHRYKAYSPTVDYEKIKFEKQRPKLD